MARLKKKFFGNLSGKFGDAVFRQQGDKNYIAQRPSSYRVPDTQDYKDRTNKFGISVKLAKAIYRIPALKTFWQKEYPDESRLFNLIVRVNYPFINSDGISSTPNITPEENGFSVSLNSSSIDENGINVQIAPLLNSVYLDPGVDTRIRLITIILFTDPLDKGLPEIRLLSLQSDDLSFSFNDPISFQILPSSKYSERLQNYRQKKAFFALVTLDDNNHLTNNSSTFFEL